MSEVLRDNQERIGEDNGVGSTTVIDNLLSETPHVYSEVANPEPSHDVLTQLKANDASFKNLDYILRVVSEIILPSLIKNGLDPTIVTRLNLGDPAKKGYEPPLKTYLKLIDILKAKGDINIASILDVLKNFDFSRIQESLIELFNLKLNPEAAGYAETKGLKATRKFIVDRERQKNPNANLDEEDVIWVNGSGKGIPLIAKIFNGKIALQIPGYPTWNGFCSFEAHGKHYSYNSNPENLYPDFNSLEKLLQENPEIMAIQFLPIGNPSSVVLSNEEIQKYIELAKKYGKVLISDNAYDNLAYDAEEPKVSKLCSDAGVPLIELKSLSKEFCLPGINGGYFIMHHPEGDIKNEILLKVTEHLFKLISPTVGSATIGQLLYPLLVKDPSYQEYLNQQRELLKKDAGNAYKILSEGLDPQKFQVIKPQGGMYLTVLMKPDSDIGVEVRDPRLNECVENLEQGRLQTASGDLKIVTRLIAETGVVLVPISGCCGPNNESYQGFRVVIMGEISEPLQRVVDSLNGLDWREEKESRERTRKIEAEATPDSLLLQLRNQMQILMGQN